MGWVGPLSNPQRTGIAKHDRCATMGLQCATAAMLLVAAAMSVSAPVSAAQTSLDCTYTTFDLFTGVEIRFSKLDLIRPYYEELDIFITDALNPDYNLYFRLCEPMRQVSDCPSDVPDSAGCEADAARGTFASLGSIASMSILDYPALDRSQGVIFMFENGTVCADGVRKRRTQVIATCHPQGTTPVSSLATNNWKQGGSEACDYQIHLSSVYACPDVVPAVCSALGDCAACTATALCGWCSTTQTCVGGNEVGPSFGQCPAPYWHWTECVDCAAIRSCQQCTAEPDCRFCSDSGGCALRTSINCLGSKVCTCPPCEAGSFCPDDGGECVPLPVCSA